MVQKIKLSGMRSLACHVMDRSSKHSLAVSVNIKINMTKVLLKKKETGHSLYTILSKSISDTIKENPRYKILNSVFIKRIFRSKIIVFDHHNFSYTFPKIYEGQEIPITYIEHDVDKKPLETIDKNIRNASRMPMEEFPIYKTLKFLTKLPSFLQKLLILVNDLFFDPSRRDGSICINNMGKTNIYSFIAIATKTLIFAFPGIDENKETLLTVTINHYVVDGRIVCDFLDDLKEKLET